MKRRLPVAVLVIAVTLAWLPCEEAFGRINGASGRGHRSSGGGFGHSSTSRGGSGSDMGFGGRFDTSDDSADAGDAEEAGDARGGGLGAGGADSHPGAGPDDTDYGDDSPGGSGSGGTDPTPPPPPDTPGPEAIAGIEAGYSEASTMYAPVAGGFADSTAGGGERSRGSAAETIERLERAQVEARAHIVAVDNTLERAAERTEASRSSSIDRAYADAGRTAGDPVAVATGVFSTSETDFAYRYGNITVAARRTYRSGSRPAGSFGPLWSWPFDSRIIRGVRPNVEADLERASEALRTTEGLRETLEAEIRGRFGGGAVDNPEETESDLRTRLARLRDFLERAKAAREQARETREHARALDRGHDDWSAPPKYRELAENTEELVADIRAQVAEAENALSAYTEIRGRLTGLAEQEARLIERTADLARDAELSAAASAANAYALRDHDPAYLVETGARTLTLIDESGSPRLYRIVAEPAISEPRELEGGLSDYYPSGSQTRALGMSNDVVRIEPDGTYVRYREDGLRFRYAPTGLLIRISDRNGNTIELHYDEGELGRITDGSGRSTHVYYNDGRIERIVDPEGHAVRYGYDHLGRLRSRTDRVGVRVEYGYEGTRLTEIRKPDGSRRRYIYERLEGRYRVVSTVDEEGNAEHFRYAPSEGWSEYENPAGMTARFFYDERFRTVRTQFGDGAELRYSWNGDDELTERTDERGFTWRYRYDEWGHRVETIDPEGNVTRTERDRYGRPIRHTDARGRTTRIRRDEAGNPIWVEYADGSRERFDYTANGRLRSHTDRLGGTTRYRYDRRGYPRAIVYPDGAEVTFEHDALGRVTRIEEETGIVTRLVYRADGLLAARMRTASDGAETHEIVYSYDNRKDRTKRVGPRGYETRYVYDDRHLVTGIVHPDGSKLALEYRADGRLSKRSLVGVSTLHYRYDARGRLRSIREEETGRVRRYRYDRAGNLVLREAPTGAITRVGYTPAGHLGWRQDPLGRRRQYDYDAVGNLIAVTDETGAVTRYRYDALDRITERVDPLGSSTRVTYDEAARAVHLHDPVGHVSTITYDERRRAVSYTDPRGGQRKRSYDAAGRLVARTDAAGGRTELSRDGFGRVAAITEPTGGTHRITYDTAGNVVGWTDPRGNRTSYTYDERGRRISVTDPAGYTIRFVRDARGNLTELVHPDGARRRYEYNGAGELVALEDERGETTELSYTGDGNLAGVTSPAGETTRFFYDPNGRLIRRTDPLGAETRFQYDAVGRMTAEIDPKGATYRFEYDAVGNLISETNRLGEVSELAYDPRHLLVEHTDFAGKTTTYRYDELGRLEQTRYHDGSESRFTYDEVGRLTQASNRHTAIALSYDAGGRLTSLRQQPSDVEVTYTYDSAGNRISRAFRPGSSAGGHADATFLEYAYDERGFLSRIIGPEGTLATFRRDARGREVERSFPNGLTTERRYTRRGRLAGVVHRSPDAGLLAGRVFLYDAVGRRTLTADARGRLTGYSYDAAGRLTEVRAPSPGEAEGEMLVLSATERAALVRRFDSVMPQRKGRLRTSQGVSVRRFSYDAVGNRTKLIGAGGERRYHYDAGRRLLKAGSTSFRYDDNGNLLAVAAPGWKKSFRYSPRNRIRTATVVTHGGKGERELSRKVFYRYDALGRRFDRRVAEKGRTIYAERILYDALGVEPLARLTTGDAKEADLGHGLGSKPGGDPVARFRYLEDERGGPGDELPEKLLYLNVDGKPAFELTPGARHVRSFATSVHGSVTAVFDEDGRVAERYAYAAFGALLGNRREPSAAAPTPLAPPSAPAPTPSAARPSPPPSSAHPLRLGYAGKLFDGLTGYYDFGYRDYDPAMARFTTVDPIKDGANWYAYVSNDPINRHDPNGLYMTVGPGLGFNEITGRYQTSDSRDLEDKAHISIIRNGSYSEFYDDTLELKVDDLTLTDLPVQSEADWEGYEQNTLPAGGYTGHLLDMSGSYNDPVLLVNNDAVTPGGDAVSVSFGALIHPNEFTNPAREGTYDQSRPWSQGCQITPGTDIFDQLRGELRNLGYEYKPGSWYSAEGEGTVHGNPDTIEVNIKNK